MFVLFGTCATDASESSFPYAAYVKSNTATVRCGPSSRHYATSRLNRGEAVEVYRIEDQRWAAIRPLQSSFSWVRDDDLGPTDANGVARTQHDNVPAYIGSSFSTNRSTAQVTLQADEAVIVLERAVTIGRGNATSDEGSSETWAKISPPAGEFRWIRLSQLSLQPPEAVTDDLSSARSNDDGSEPRQLHSVLVTDTFDRTSIDSANPDDSSAGPSEENDAVATTVSDDVVNVLRELANDQPAGDEQVVPAQFTEVAAPRTADTRSLRGGDALSWNGGEAGTTFPSQPLIDNTTQLINELIAIHVALSEQMTKTVGQWRVGDLRIRTQAIIDTSTSTEVRRQAQTLLSQIAQCEDLIRRYQMYSTTALSEGGADALNAIDSHTGNDVAGANYDGAGWLMRVASNRSGAPRYALTDRFGNVVKFVVPQPGLNLSRFERKHVGVLGETKSSSLDKPILTAERIIALDGLR